MTREQIAFLKKLASSPISRNSLREDEKVIKDYLVSQKYAKERYVGDFNESDRIIAVEITQSGLIELENSIFCIRKERRARITLIVAILAFILSVLSLSWQIYSWRLTQPQAQELQSPSSQCPS